MTLDQAVQQFIEQGHYLRNWSPKTVRCYRQCLVIFQRSVTDFPPKPAFKRSSCKCGKKGARQAAANAFTR